ncbi:MAG: HDOD domain-containing protein [Helicobacteraceae bacterium]|jgi:HD-like signal output (HDOD) protein|nr:HDOD domain-containing protein [Helicobacteraceae bacterium]
MNNAILAHIKTLPPLPESVVKIQTICSDPNSGVADLAKVIENDPMLTANLLKAANSPLYGFSREIKTLAQAVSLFGMATVRGFALAGAVRSTLKIDLSPYRLDAEQFAGLSQLQNALMLKWFGQINRTMLDVLSPASFLTNVGRVIIAQEIVKNGNMEAFIRQCERGGVESAEIEMLDISYQEVSAEMFRQWRFEEAIVNAISFSRCPEEAVSPVKEHAEALHVVQAAVLTPGGITQNSISKASEIAGGYGLSPELFTKAASQFI